MPESLNLDVESPEQLPAVLRLAAQRFNESAGELESARQDTNPGKVWERMARILERAADSCERAI
jgi:hypothetical protein